MTEYAASKIVFFDLREEIFLRLYSPRVGDRRIHELEATLTEIIGDLFNILAPDVNVDGEETEGSRVFKKVLELILHCVMMAISRMLLMPARSATLDENTRKAMQSAKSPSIIAKSQQSNLRYFSQGDAKEIMVRFPVPLRICGVHLCS